MALQVTSVGEYSILPYPPERGVTTWGDPHTQQVSDALSARTAQLTKEALQRQADRSFGQGTLSYNDKQPSRQVTYEEKVLSNNNKFNDLFKDNTMHGNIKNFENQVLKNDYPEEQNFMNGVGYWEAVLYNFVTEGMKPKYGFGINAGKYQVEFMETPIGKNIEKKLKGYYKKVRIDKEKLDKQLFNSAIQDMVEGIPEYWRNKALQEGRIVELGGGSKKLTTRKYKNKKLSYRRYNKNRTTKNKRRYSRRK